MSFNSFASNLNKKFQDLSVQVSQKAQDASANLPSFAATQRMVQEKFGQVTDISQLPQEYIELEKKVDSIKMIHQNFLQITSIYESESYDYPKFAKDSVNDFSKTVALKVQELSHASSASEAQNILVSPGPVKDPKTLNYALSKVALTSSELIHQGQSNSPQDTRLASTLLEYSNTQAKIAQARIQQDTLIQTKFNKHLRDELSESIERAAKARKDVHNKRLQYDVARTNLLNAKPEKEASLRVEMETLEDQFAQATESATLVMQETIANSHFLANLNELATAQQNYFEASAKLMKEFIANSHLEAEDPIAPASKEEESSTVGGISLSEEK